MCIDFLQWCFSFIQSMPFNNIVDTLLIAVYVWHFSHDLVHFVQCKYMRVPYCTGAKINGAQDILLEYFTCTCHTSVCGLRFIIVVSMCDAEHRIIFSAFEYE